jgi:hypothetical protein
MASTGILVASSQTDLVLSTRIGPGYPVLVLTTYDSLPCYILPPGTSDVTPLTQLHTHFSLLSPPPLYINRSRNTI